MCDNGAGGVYVKICLACPINEYWDRCMANCDGCDLSDIPFNERPCASICTPGCICGDGYYRNDEGLCIPDSQCPKGKFD